MRSVLVVGLGEVGSAIMKLEKEIDSAVFVIERKSLITPGTGVDYNTMHVCIPYSEEFVDICNKYVEKYRPGKIIIHSTVKEGITEKLQSVCQRPVAHSPVRGIHPNLYEGLKTFTKYFGCDEEFKELFEKDLQKLGVKTYYVGETRASELLKLLDTSYYGHCIMFAKAVKKYCDKSGVDFDKVYTHANITYNDGYTKLGKSNVVRPVLYPPEGVGLGGHCVQQNYELLSDSTLKTFFKIMNEEDY